MKKIILFISLFFLLTGCMKYNDKNLINDINKQIKNSDNYRIMATLEIFRNEEKFTYDITSTYQEKDNYMVKLYNKSNNHEQIILKKDQSVYVFTPALNKSFKFQSDWPYNNSQIYLLQPIMQDIEKDEKREFLKTKEGYIITSQVNYSNEKEFEKQKVYFDSNKKLTKVEVIDKNKIVKMRLNVVSIEYDTDIERDYFDIKKYQKENFKSTPEKEEQTSTIEDIVYPMYIPTETYLSSQNVVKTDVGERVILTFSGESEFTLIQENLISDSNERYVYGDPQFILDTIGAVTDSSISWITNGIEYSVISDTLSLDEMLVVAQSMSVEPITK